EVLDTAANGQPAQRVVILGGGLIGCEFANDLLHRGIEPTVVDLADRPLSRLLPSQASQRLRDKLEAAGARFRFGTGVASVDLAEAGAASRLVVSLSDGSTLPADIVLSAIGLRPRTHLATEAGVLTGQGVMVNRHLATNRDHVYAI